MFQAGVNVSGRYRKWPVFSRPLMAGFGCPPRFSRFRHRSYIRPVVQITPAKRADGLEICRSLVLGIGFLAREGEASVSIADPSQHRLSFENMLKLHVLAALRHVHGVRMRGGAGTRWTTCRRSFASHAR